MKKKVSYKAALKDPRWQRKRLAIFERAGWCCEWCGAARSHLQVHHGYYGKTAGKLREPWEVRNDVLYCLCRLCHEKAEVAKQALYLEVGRIHPKEHWELRDVLKRFLQGMGEKAKLSGPRMGRSTGKRSKSMATGIEPARMGLPRDRDGGEYGGVQLQRP